MLDQSMSMQLLVQASAHPIGARSSPASAFLGSSIHQHESHPRAGNFRARCRVVCELEESQQKKVDRWSGLGTDTSDDQQDITRGKGMVDALYQGPQGDGTQTAVMSSLEYINTAQRMYSMDNVKDGFYIAPAFMEKLVIHIAKNFMTLPNVKVPLILGIWGGKGQGKSFQCELVFSKLGINPITMSAGELESGNAGEPAKLIRQRYRQAADIIRKKGQMCVLFINDLDAGAGRMGSTTQYTVNNQMVNATLMNIADNPTNVQLPGIYTKEEIPRVPVIVTGNDFSTLYAPLIRDGRMEKFYWAPTREDRIGVCQGIFRSDDIPADDIVKLVDTFPGQSIDFFGALRARVYDDEVRKWISGVGVSQIGSKLVNSKEGPPTFAKPAMTIDKLLEYGSMLVKEQENVKKYHLAEKYMKGSSLGDANEDERPFYGKAAQAVKVPVPAGCSDPSAKNFDPTVRSDDGTCEYDFAEKAPAAKQDNLYGKAAQQVNIPVPEGCTDSQALNFDPTARSDDGTCEYDFAEKAPAAKQDDIYGKAAQQVNIPVPEGCTDSQALNFDPTARSDDGTCEYDFAEKASAAKQDDNLYGKAAQQVNIPVPEGCTDSQALNFDPTARSDDGTCEYDFAEKAPAAKQDLYGKAAQQVNIPVPEGCTDSQALNFDPTARSDDGTCVYDFSEIEKSQQNNLYGKAAQQINIPVPEGCTDSNAANFDPTARSDDGTCEYDFAAETSQRKILDAEKSNLYGKAAQQINIPVPEGCADPNAANYDPTARSDNGSCTYDFDEFDTDAIKEDPEEIPAAVAEEKKRGLPEKVLRAVVSIILLPFSGRKPSGQGDTNKQFLRFLIGKRSLAAQIIIACAVATTPGIFPFDAFADEEPYPSVTRKVFMEISIDGEPAGRIVIGIYENDVPVGAKRFGEITAGQKGLSYRKRDFYKITKKYIQNAGLRTFSLSGRVKDTAEFYGGLDAKALVNEIRELDQTGKRPKNVKGSVSIVAIDATKPPPKPKLIARDGKFEVVYEESRPDPNGTEFCIAYDDAPELDPTNLVVGRVLEGMDVVEKIANTRVVKDNTGNLYFQTAKLIGDTRAVVAERGFNRPYSKIIVSKCGILEN